jgi:hypothetical protein
VEVETVHGVDDNWDRRKPGSELTQNTGFRRVRVNNGYLLMRKEAPHEENCLEILEWRPQLSRQGHRNVTDSFCF